MRNPPAWSSSRPDMNAPSRIFIHTHKILCSPPRARRVAKGLNGAIGSRSMHDPGYQCPIIDTLGRWVNSVGYLGGDAFLGHRRADRRDAAATACSVGNWGMEANERG